MSHINRLLSSDDGGVGLRRPCLPLFPHLDLDAEFLRIMTGAVRGTCDMDAEK